MPDFSNPDYGRVVIADSPESVGSLAARDFIGEIQHLQNLQPDRFVEIAISAGSACEQVLPLVDVTAVNWSRVRFWWADERFVPEGHRDRNDLLARLSLLDRVPAAELHPLPTSASTDYAAPATLADLAAAAKTASAEWDKIMGQRALDIALLGMGPDGHFASLFPGFGQLDDTSQAVLAVKDSPKPPPLRTTLNRQILVGANKIMAVVLGDSKAAALAEIFDGVNYHQRPSAALRTPHTTWYLDRAAAGPEPFCAIDPC